MNLINIRRINNNLTLGTLDIEEFAKGKQFAGKRETEREATKLLLKKLYGNNSPELCYTAENKPYFNNHNDHLSISHSHAMLAILIDQKESCGIDTELIRDKIINIKHKFLSAAELSFAGNDIAILTLLWAAKEAIYKAYGLKQIDFIANMSIDAFRETDEEIFGYLHKENVRRKYLLRKEIIGNYALVHTLHEIQ